MMLRLRTLGSVCLERDGVPLAGQHAQRRRLALLAYLAATGDAPVTRDKLMTLLWPERNAQRGRHSLSQLLYALRQELPAQSLIASAEEVRLDSALLSSDVRELNHALAAGNDERAFELYRGPFLDGFFVDDAPDFERWAATERAELAARMAGALGRLAERAERAGDRFRLLEWRRALVKLDPADGRAVLQLMQVLASVGDRAGALQQARLHEAFVRDELGDEPDAEVIGLAARLRKALPSESSTVEPIPSPESAGRLEPTHPVAVADAVHVAERKVRSRPRWWSAASGVLILAIVFAVLPRLRGQDSAPAHGKVVTVLVGDLAGSDTVLALAVREALRAELSASQTVTQISDQRARQIQTLMGRTTPAALRPPLLLEVALRSGAQIALTGSATPLGSGAQLLVQLLDPRTGDVLKTVSERAASIDEVVPSVATMGRALRAALANVPPDTTIRALPAVSTTSLPALKSYALARKYLAAAHHDSARQHAERALMHDSLFALAHYLAGDLLWFMDQQTHAETHLARARELSERLPLRERLVIRARYEQLVMDRPDSALTYWDLLHDAVSEDPIAYEGRSWTLRSLGRYEEAAAAADSALQLDPAAVLPNASNALFSWLSVGDTSRAIRFAQQIASQWPDALIEAHYHAALVRSDIARAIEIANRTPRPAARAARLQDAYLTAGDLPRAREQLTRLRENSAMAFLPRGVLAQGAMELAISGDRRAAAAYAREALHWVRDQDLSAPALARLAERIGDLAARAGDVATLDATIDLVRRRDRGRMLQPYVLAQRTLEAARAFARGDPKAAAELAKEARYGVYFSRSLNTVVRLEADARRRSGDTASADSLDRMIEVHQIADGDFWTWVILRAMTRRNSGSKTG